jgi:putative aldouronate transport system substrate-binding protein
MKKGNLLKVISTVAATLLLTTSLTGCFGSKEEASTSGENEATTLKVFFSGDLKKIDEVVDEFEKNTKETLNLNLDITTASSADYKEKLRMMMTAGEEMDMVFDAPWANMNTLINQGGYAELDSYFNNDEYPGLKKAFSKDFLEANKVNGHIYGVPITQTFIDLPGFFIRKDIREKYGIPQIKNDEELIKFFETVLENEETMAPVGIRQNRGFQNFLNDYDRMPLVNSNINYMIISGTGAFPMEAAIDTDTNKLISITTLGDSEKNFASLPAPYNKDLRLERYLKYEEINKYAQNDSIVEKDNRALFAAGKVASAEGEISGLASMQDKIKALGGDVEFYPYLKSHREMVKGGIETDYKAWNFLCIPATSEKIDESMKFLDWIFSSQENNDLFTFGIEGKHWEAVGDSEWRLPEGVNANDNYSFPGYELTWNPNYIRIPADLDSTSKKYISYQNDLESYTKRKNPLAGYTFNNQSIKTELAQVQAVGDKYYVPFQHGVVKNVEEDVKKYYKEAQDAGLEKVREEVRKQIEEFLAKK